MIELFCKSIYRLKTVTYFRKKRSNTALETVSPTIKKLLGFQKDYHKAHHQNPIMEISAVWFNLELVFSGDFYFSLCSKFLMRSVLNPFD